MLAPMPDGVPVKTTSPGSRVTIAESFATSAGTEKIMAEVRPFWTLSPLTRQPSSRSSGSSPSPRSSSAVTRAGPTGEKPG